MRKLITKIRLWIKRVYPNLYKLYYKITGRVHNPRVEMSEFFKAIIQFRKAEILIVGPQKNIITGHSIVHAGESYFESIPEVKIHCTAISGDRTSTMKIRLVDNVTQFMPEKVLFDVHGNDFLAGRPIAEVIANIRGIVVQMRALLPNVKIGWLELLPVGDPKGGPLQAKLEGLNFSTARLFNKQLRLLATELKFDYIPIRSKLKGADGWIKPGYGTPDLIHVTPRAYGEVYVPVATEFFKGG